MDFGCGGGFLLRQLHCARGIGIEINPAARRFAELNGTEMYGTVEECPDGVADVVISNHALEHVPYPIGALSALRRKLKAGGRLVLCVPIDNWRQEKRYDSADKNHHLHTWTPLLLGHTLCEAGYSDIQATPRINAWPGRWTVATYGRLPYWCFRQICFWYGWVSGKGWDIVATARPCGGDRGCA
jgi:SAM-dependent methyltransferase